MSASFVRSLVALSTSALAKRSFGSFVFGIAASTSAVGSHRAPGEDDTPNAALPPSFDRARFEEWREQIAPTPGQLAWLDVGWRPQLGMAVVEAAETPRPILLWAMNGHPLGCT